MTKISKSACWGIGALIVLSAANPTLAQSSPENTGADMTRIPDTLNANIGHMTQSLDALTLGELQLFEGKGQTKWRIFGDAGTGAGTQKSQPAFADSGFRLRSRFISAGAERQFGESFSIGGAFSGLSSKTSLTESNSSFSSDGTMTTVFAKWQTGSTLIGLSSRYGKLNIDDIQQDTGVALTAPTSETDGEYRDWTVWGALPIQSSFGVITPYAKAVFSRTKVDAFDENTTSAQGLALSHEEQKLKSRRTEIGLRYDATPLNITDSFNFQPWLDFSYGHEFADGRRDTVSVLRDGTANPIMFTTAPAYRNRFSIGSGAAFKLADNLELALTYRHDFGKDTVLNSQFGLRASLKF